MSHSYLTLHVVTFNVVNITSRSGYLISMDFKVLYSGRWYNSVFSCLLTLYSIKCSHGASSLKSHRYFSLSSVCPETEEMFYQRKGNQTFYSGHVVR